MSSRIALARAFSLVPCLVAAALASPAAAEPPVGCTNAFELEVVDLVNEERANAAAPCPCEPLELDVRLVEAAQRHSDDMASNNFHSHIGSDGSTPQDRMEDAGYLPWTWLAENIAAGYPTPAAVVAGWMASPGHKANILDPNLEHLGVGYAFNAGATYDHYWTNTFGASSDPNESPLGYCPVCSDATDNDGDGLRDDVEDPGCGTEHSTIENPRCDDDLDNDLDGGTDWDGGPAAGPVDPQCQGKPWRSKETPGSCGLGFELAPLLAGLVELRRRRRHRA